MKITIRLRYHTHFGQALFLCGEHESLGGGRQENAVALHYLNDEFWEATIEFSETARPKTPLSYYFFVRNPDGSVVEDFGGDRKLSPALLVRDVTVVIDSWNELGTVENIYSTEPFKNVLLRQAEETETSSRIASHTFNVKSPLLPRHQTICLIGSARAFGGWNIGAPVLFRRVGEAGFFSAKIDLQSEYFPMEYKYGVFDTGTNTFVEYEAGGNRRIEEGGGEVKQVVVNDGFARLSAKRWRGAGVAIPVFSLRSEKSFGAGEFLDLKALADWARLAGLKLIQILPVNDTSASHTWTDSYPYAAISAFALHPLYLNLDRLGGTEGLAKERQKLNALESLDYEAVMRLKMAFVRKIFPAQRRATLEGAEYRNFFAQNEHWLAPYAAFCVLRDNYGTSDFDQWPEHRTYDAKAAGALRGTDEFALHCFIQFHLHLQLHEAAEYIHAQGLILKGDIAIGVHRHGADVWQNPALFNTAMQAGAPPDPFAAKGQNWGFPTYNWPRMKEDGFAWWKRRFGQMGHYFDAFRIDHILGFFRIWSVPVDAVEGILGYFVPAIPVEPREFAERGIAFDRDRFTQPFTTGGVLHEIFGDRDAEVKRHFMAGSPEGGIYRLKPEFATQRAVEKRVTDARLREGLFDVISNVLLIETPGGALHFRLGMEQTASFRELDGETRGRLSALYVDYFFRRQDDFWRREAMQKLPALKRVTNMLICGEDLGMVPACVPDVMKQLGLLSLEIQRMPKTLNTDFSRPADAPYLSVVTPSTHDMSTIRGWWTEDRKGTQKFFNQELGHPGPAPEQCDTGINREVVRQHLESPAMWSIFQLQDLLGMDDTLRRADVNAERINVPAIPNYYWRYRMHLTLEALARAVGFNGGVAGMVRQAGRSGFSDMG